MPSITDVPVRGVNYLEDRKKFAVKRTLLRLVAMDCYSTHEPRVDHVAQHPANRIAIAKRANRLPSFTWLVVIQIPGSAAASTG
jgi:hypothetical protein